MSFDNDDKSSVDEFLEMVEEATEGNLGENEATEDDQKDEDGDDAD